MDLADQDTTVFNPEASDEEHYDTAIDTTSDDWAIIMGKPVKAAFISDLGQIPTKKVGCLVVTCWLQEFLKQIYKYCKC